MGNKRGIALEIQKYFPPHKIYVEPFFGAGGMFFNKPKSKYNIVNDLDSDVYNLFQVVSNFYEELETQFLNLPLHQGIFEEWKTKIPENNVIKAIRFLFLSNYSFQGGMASFAFGVDNQKNRFSELLKKTNKLLFNVQFGNTDFRTFLNSLNRVKDKNTFIYCDPPYLSTGNNYSNSFTEQDSKELFETLISTGCKFAISEFDNSIILDLAKSHNLEVVRVGERQNLKNKRTEILIINYPNPCFNLFDLQ